MNELIYKRSGIDGYVYVKLPEVLIRIGTFSYRLMTGGDKSDPIAGYNDSSETPRDTWKGYNRQINDNKDLVLLKDETIKKWNIKIDKEIQQELIYYCFVGTSLDKK